MEALYDKHKSLTVLKILFKDGNQAVFYSLLRLDKKGRDYGVYRLVQKFVKNPNFKGKYKAATIYENTHANGSGDVLLKFNEKGELTI